MNKQIFQLSILIKRNFKAYLKTNIIIANNINVARVKYQNSRKKC